MADVKQAQAPVAEEPNYGLGPCRGFHGFDSAGRDWRWLLLIGCLALYVFCTGCAAGAGLAYLFKIEGYESALGFPIGSLGAVLVSWWLWRVRKRVKGNSVALCEEGMIVTQRGKIRPIRWDEITALWQKVQTLYVNGINTGTRFQYTLKLKNGETRKVCAGLQRMAELGAALDREITGRLLPSCTAMFDAGQPIALGEFTITRQGVARNGNLLPWESVGSVYLDSGFLIVTRRSRSAAELVVTKTLEGARTLLTSVAGTFTPMSGGGQVIWTKAPAAKVPNLSILLFLAGQCQGVRFE